MAVFACTMFFEIPNQNTGWTETWYRNFNDSQAALLAFTTVAAARGAILGSGANLVKIRVSDVAITGDSAEKRDIAFQKLPADCNFASVGWLVRYEATDLYRSERVIRGMSKAAFDNAAPRTIADPASAQRVGAYHLTLLNAYSFRVKKRGPGATEVGISKLAYDPVTNEVTVTTTQNHTFVAGNTVNHIGLRQYVKQVRGLHLVLSVTANTYKFALFKPFPEFIELTGPYNGKGKSRLVEFDYPIVARIVEQRWTDRQSGSPFDLQVGRQ